MDFRRFCVYFFDLDGVLSVGKENPSYLGGREVVAKVKSLGKKSFVLTNDSTHTRNELLANLVKIGFGFSIGEILTSSYLTATYLKQKFGKASFYLVGEDGLRLELEAMGHVETDKEPDAVVVGLDRGLSYDKLNTALKLLKKGAFLVGGYGGATYMSARGPAMSAGPIVKALEYASGKRAAIIGKPSPRIFRLALRMAHEKPSNAVMVGDQVETDLVGAKKAGVRTVLVLTGVENRGSVAGKGIKPDLILGSVDDLLRLI